MLNAKGESLIKYVHFKIFYEQAINTLLKFAQKNDYKIILIYNNNHIVIRTSAGTRISDINKWIFVYYELKECEFYLCDPDGMNFRNRFMSDDIYLNLKLFQVIKGRRYATVFVMDKGKSINEHIVDCEVLSFDQVSFLLFFKL
jgi:hypothetical protein